MKSTHLLFAIVALTVGGFLCWWLSQGELAPAPVPEGELVPAVAAIDASAANAELHTNVVEDATIRRAVENADAVSATDDPEVRAGLTGFRGRVVDHRAKPVADCGVRLYRGAMDSILPAGLHPMAETTAWQPGYVAGETRTDTGGKFLIEQVWPRAFYVLLAGIGTDAPSHRFLQHAPEPGQVLDLGDIVLDPCGVIVGTVVDDNGDPLAGALVRAVDLPGAVVAALPVERFDPKGCLIVREPSAPMTVLEMPAWVERAFADLPIPQTRTDAEGRFRLAGVMPGNNYVATTSAGLLADIKPAVKVESGETKDVGTIKLKEGEDLAGRVVDSAGKPIAGAEVIAGTVTAMAPIDFASRIGVTDDEGRFTATGFGAGKVSVAARRNAEDPWVRAEPQPILGDVTVTLPAIGNLTVRVRLAAEIVLEPKLKLMPSKETEEAFVLSTIGFVQPVVLTQRTQRREDGSTVLSGLPLGRYVLLAQAEGAAVTAAEVDLTQGDATVQLDLLPSRGFDVRVLGPEDKPIRNADVFVLDRGDRKSGQRRGEMPVRAGRTDAQGRLRIDEVSSWNVRVSAEHPRWGTVHAQMESEQAEVVLRMQAPGHIEGVLVDGGKPIATGKFMVAAEYRNQGQRGATEGVPALATPGLDGKFALRAVQPGSWRLAAVPAAEGVHSPGGVMSFLQSAMGHREQEQTIEVASGQTANVTLDVQGATYDGPVGVVFGTVQLDGRLAAGAQLRAWANNQELMATVDDTGRYHFDAMPTGGVHLSLQLPDAGLFDRRGIWNTNFELAQAESKEVNIVVDTTGLGGIVVRPDGAPAASLHIQVQGRALDDKSGNTSMWHHVSTDADGRFKLERIAAGIYQLETSGGENDRMRGELRDVRVEGGRPVMDLRLQLRTTVEFSGRIDMSVFGGEPEWIWMTFHAVDTKNPEHRWGPQIEGISVEKDGTFKTKGLDPGSYFVNVHAMVQDKWNQYPIDGQVTVPAGGQHGVQLQPSKPEPRKR